jgi:hypothetical protein
MEINKVSSFVHTNTNDIAQKEVEQWLDHGYKLGATHAVLYFDRFDNTRAMSYVFQPNTLDELIDRLKRDGQTIYQAWQYDRN